MNVGQDFKFRDDLHKPKQTGDTVPIELLIGPYKGVIYRYVKIAIKEQDDGKATLQFIYDLLEMGNHTETSLRADKKFTDCVGLILNQLILEALEIKEDDIREDDFAKPVSRGGL
jgi:hypothetical protein